MVPDSLHVPFAIGLVLLHKAERVQCEESGILLIAVGHALVHPFDTGLHVLKYGLVLRAVETLVKKYQSPIRRFFLHQTLGDTELSDDLAQETFIKAYTNLASFKNLSSFSTWLYRIAYNIFYDYIRSKKETSGLETWEIDAVYQTEQRQVGEHMDIYRGLSQLKEVERTCITLFFMEDLPIEKIAVITGMPAGTIKSHLSRGKTKLTTFLKQNGYDGKR